MSVVWSHQVNLSLVTQLRTAYFDHAATTDMEPQAVDAYAHHMGMLGNASSLHSRGRAARRVVEESRETIARAFGAHPSEVVFTGGGTESDNLAVKGLFWARNVEKPRPKIVISAVEHHAVMDPAHWLETHEGAEIVWIPVDECGLVSIDVLENVLRDNADSIAFVSVMWANNEVGTIQPVADIVALAHSYDVPVHSDAVQAAGHVDVNFSASGLDAMTITAHKLGGPVGVGALFLRRDVKVVPVIHGGGQERSVRSGTLDTAGIASFAAAVSVVRERIVEHGERLVALRNLLMRRVRETIPSAVVQGIDPEGENAHLRLPSNAHFTFDNCEGDSLIFLLDSQGVAASTGSACQAGVPQPSHVLLAMGVSESVARGALRFSLGNTTSMDDVDLLLDVLPQAVERASAAGLASAGK
ncbi:cysteine desulfurase family protein [Timonella sp. A28]|uniref:cysteine desulfurase family protein n=1 Tax=Timonella sp. A28 TaxID=3442640 RepID=UPI003EB8FA9B